MTTNGPRHLFPYLGKTYIVKMESGKVPHVFGEAATDAVLNVVGGPHSGREMVAGVWPGLRGMNISFHTNEYRGRPSASSEGAERRWLTSWSMSTARNCFGRTKT